MRMGSLWLSSYSLITSLPFGGLHTSWNPGTGRGRLLPLKHCLHAWPYSLKLYLRQHHTALSRLSDSASQPRPYNDPNEG